MKNKLLKKVLGIFEYKLIDKNLFKNNRLLSDKSFLTMNGQHSVTGNDSLLRCSINLFGLVKFDVFLRTDKFE